MPLQTVYWNEEMETLPAENMLELQFRRLLDRVKYVAENGSFYRKKFLAAGLCLFALERPNRTICRARGHTLRSRR